MGAELIVLKKRRKKKSGGGCLQFSWSPHSHSEVRFSSGHELSSKFHTCIVLKCRTTSCIERSCLLLVHLIWHAWCQEFIKKKKKKICASTLQISVRWKCFRSHQNEIACPSLANTTADLISVLLSTGNLNIIMNTTQDGQALVFVSTPCFVVTQVTQSGQNVTMWLLAFWVVSSLGCLLWLLSLVAHLFVSLLNV